jgi:hypothetical protein
MASDAREICLALLHSKHKILRVQDGLNKVHSDKQSIIQQL